MKTEETKVWVPLEQMTDEEIIKESARRRERGETAHANELLAYLKIRNAKN